MVDHKKGLIKSGIVAASAGGAYTLGVLVEAICPDSIKGFADFTQHLATVLTPYFLADKYMDDVKPYKYTIQAFTAVLGVPYLVEGFADFTDSIGVGNNLGGESLRTLVRNTDFKGKLNLLGLAIPFIKPAYDFLKK